MEAPHGVGRLLPPAFPSPSPSHAPFANTPGPAVSASRCDNARAHGLGQSLLTPDQVARIEANRRQGASCALACVCGAVYTRLRLAWADFASTYKKRSRIPDTVCLSVQRSSGAHIDLPPAVLLTRYVSAFARPLHVRVRLRVLRDAGLNSCGPPGAAPSTRSMSRY